MSQASVFKFSAPARLLGGALLAAFGCVSAARAQAPTPPREGGVVVRERRAAEAPKEAKEAKEAKETKEAKESPAAPKDAGAAAGPAEEKPSEGAGGEAPGGEEEAKAADDTSLEALRARVGAEKNQAARARLQRELVERLSAEGRAAEAVGALREMLAEERFDPPFFYNVGNLLARLGESDAAVEAYRKAAGQRRGNYARAQHNLGVVLIRLGRMAEAEEALTAALKLENFNYAEASYNLGRLYALRGEAGLAIAEWQRTLRLKPDHADAAVALARALAEDGDPRAALGVLDSFGAHATRGGQTAPAEVTAARAEIVSAVGAREDEREGEGAETGPVSREPGGPRSSLRPLVVRPDTYGYLRRARAARESDRLTEAVALYGDAIRSNGGYFAPANLELGFALTGLHRTEEAVENFRLVTRRSGSRYPIAFYHLGRLHEHAGRLAEAADSYARAAELLGESDPQFYADLSRVREKEGKRAEALAAIENYAAATGRRGEVPAWARQRIDRLRGQESPAAKK